MVKRRVKNARIALVQLFLLLAILVFVNILAGSFFYRIDLTEEKRFSISEPTREILGSLDDVLFIKVYLEGEMTPNVSRLRNATREMIESFRIYAGRNIQYEFIDPTAIEDENNRYAYFKELEESGVFSIPYNLSDEDELRQKYLFPYALVRFRDREEAVLLLNYLTPLDPTYDPSAAISLLEYKLSRAIKKIVVRDKKRIAFIEGHGELDTLQVGDVANSLRSFYEMHRLDLTTVNQIDTTYDALVIARPTESFPKVDKYKLDQYLMKGGSILWFIDKLAADFDSLQRNPEFFTQPFPLDIDDNLYQYGLRINNDLIQDQQCARINAPYGDSWVRKKWFYSPILTNTNPYHPISKGLDAIESRFINTIDTIPVPGIRKTILLRSSENSRVLPDPVRVRYNIIAFPPRDEMFDKAFLPVAVLLEGRFNSAYKTNRFLAETFSNAGVGSDAFIEKGREAKMIVVSDADIIRNYVGPDGKIFPLGLNNIEQYLFGNKDFVMNCVEYLVDDSGLMETRAKEVRLRPLNASRVKASRTSWQLINIAVPLIAIFLFGAAYHALRKRMHTYG